MVAKKIKKRPTKSPEERRAEAQVLHDTLTAQAEALAESGEWARFLEFVGSFHAYSFNNLMLILAQRPEATMVAGFRQWQAKGRQVRKGERSIKIRGYSTKKVTQEDPETGDEVERRLARFPVLSVFDISQTDPIEGAEPLPEHPAQRLTGDDHAGIFEAMAEHMSGLGWSVTRERIAGELNGYTTTDGTRRIVVDADLTPVQAAKTMLHEAAHATLHVDEDGAGDAAEYVAHRGRFECEAESVAYVLAGLLEVDTSAYSVGYVTTWTKGEVDAVRACAENVLRAVHQLAPALLDDVDQAADAAA
ncbi:ArdC-like ssDNA-binding domain-containing protein [Nocardioides pacificus]